jgi:ferric-dicitrate binding protein FerR (iron transport regulator)
MDIRKFRKKLKRYQQGKTNETENALVDAWYRSYTAEEAQVNEAEVERSRVATREKMGVAATQAKVYRFPIMKMAAAIALLVCSAVAIWKLAGTRKSEPQYYTVSTGINSIKKLILPDGSTVWLNSATSLQIPENFEGEVRRLIVNEGEAFFDVHHDVRRPFIVQTSALNVQVLGTSFNIKTFKSLKYTRIGVATGKVGVIRNGKTLAMLTPGKELVFNKTKAEFNIETIDIEQLQGWKTGSTYLTNADFEEVALTLKNIYGITLKTASKKINDYRFTLILKHGIPVGDALKLITQIHNTHFKKEGNEVTVY